MHTTTRVDELKCISLAKSLHALNPNLKVSLSNALFIICFIIIVYNVLHFEEFIKSCMINSYIKFNRYLKLMFSK